MQLLLHLARELLFAVSAERGSVPDFSDGEKDVGLLATPISCKLCGDFVFLEALWKPGTHYTISRLFSHRCFSSMTSADLLPCSLGMLVFKQYSCEQIMGGNRVHSVEGVVQLNNHVP